MVVSLALTVAKPRQARHRNYDDSYADSKLGLLLHRKILPNRPNLSILSQGSQGCGQFFGQAAAANFTPVERPAVVQNHCRVQICRHKLRNKLGQLLAEQNHSLWLERPPNSRQRRRYSPSQNFRTDGGALLLRAFNQMRQQESATLKIRQGRFERASRVLDVQSPQQDFALSLKGVSSRIEDILGVRWARRAQKQRLHMNWAVPRGVLEPLQTRRNMLLC